MASSLYTDEYINPELADQWGPVFSGSQINQGRVDATRLFNSIERSIMNRSHFLLCLVILALSATNALASVFGDVRGTVIDPQALAIPAARVNLRSASSSFSRATDTDVAGEFSFRAVPIGEYTVTVESGSFSKSTLALVVLSDRTTVLRVMLTIAPVSQQVEVRGEPGRVDSGSATPVTLVSRKDIARTPGADRTNSLALITNYVPGSYVTHNQLHIRGGHQVTWLVDGVPVPNTNIADTVGPQFDPKDIDYLEVQRGSYTAEYGDRTYAMFNVVPRSGFERKREAELLVSYGNFNQTNDQLSLGSHTKLFAYYASVNANRSDYGLETPVARVLHDQSNGFGGFVSLIFNANPKDQFRLVAAVRRDFFQVPNDQDAQGAGIRDVERERDA
ncbi:MAG TPA: carboxypeptidase regulatory-like domain-containing protein, partial [Pyrinomonadaceae bacterium]|nr:carboxypeptidase regulatory-like domain-containing protein [Pyrinomonadaceae bacterium]